MSCEFENTPCAMTGNFVCKKCKICGYAVGMAAAVAETQWPQVLEQIKTNCQHNKTPDQPALQPVAGKTFAEAATAAVNAQYVPTGSQPALPPDYVDPTLQAGVQNPFEPAPDETGVGTQLKRLLGKIGIKATPTCSCNAKARHMDAMGIQWCEQNIDTIVGWLKEEAQNRKLPFIDMAGKMLVNRAISAAKKAQTNKLKKLKLSHDV